MSYRTRPTPVSKPEVYYRKPGWDEELWCIEIVYPDGKVIWIHILDHWLSGKYLEYPIPQFVLDRLQALLDVCPDALDSWKGKCVMLGKEDLINI